MAQLSGNSRTDFLRAAPYLGRVEDHRPSNARGFYTQEMLETILR
jgi:hypothetical protein